MWRIMLWTIMNNMWTLFLYRSITVLLSKQLATATVTSERVVTTKPEPCNLMCDLVETNVHMPDILEPRAPAITGKGYANPAHC